MGGWENDCSFETGVLSVILANFTHDWRLVILEPYPQRKYLYYVNIIKYFFLRFIESMGVCANDCFFGIGVHSVKCAIYTGWRLIALEPYPQRNYLSNYHNNHTSRYTDSMGVGGNDCSFWHRRQQCNLGLYTPLTTSDTGAVSPTELRNLVCSMQINLIDLILHGGVEISNLSNNINWLIKIILWFVV